MNLSYIFSSLYERCEQKDSKIQIALMGHRAARQNELHKKGEHSHIRQQLDGRLVEVHIPVWICQSSNVYHLWRIISKPSIFGKLFRLLQSVYFKKSHDQPFVVHIGSGCEDQAWAITQDHRQGWRSIPNSFGTVLAGRISPTRVSQSCCRFFVIIFQ